MKRDLRPRSGPFNMGQQGYLVIAVIILALIITAVTGRLPTHTAPHIP